LSFFEKRERILLLLENSKGPEKEHGQFARRMMDDEQSSYGYLPSEFANYEAISDRLKCTICHEVCRNAVQTPGDHLYCESCLLRWLESHETDPATNLKVDASEIRKADRLIRRMIMELNVVCCHRSKGCMWSGTLEKRGDHLFEHCRYTEKHERMCRDFEDMKDEIKDLKNEVNRLKGVLSVKDATIKQLAHQLSESLQETKEADFAEAKDAHDVDTSFGDVVILSKREKMLRL